MDVPTESRAKHCQKVQWEKAQSSAAAPIPGEMRYAELKDQEAFLPIATACAKTTLSLPLYRPASDRIQLELQTIEDKYR